MKQVELAKRLGISKSYLSMILSGQRRCPTEIASKLSFWDRIYRLYC